MDEILDDTKGEAAQHGRVIAIAAPKPGAKADEDDENIPGLDEASLKLKCFVQFETVEAAIACAKDMHNRQFDGRTVLASFASVTSTITSKAYRPKARQDAIWSSSPASYPTPPLQQDGC